MRISDWSSDVCSSDLRHHQSWHHQPWPRRAPRHPVGGPMKAVVHVTLKTGVLDPQGRAIGHALGTLGFTGVGDVRQGKVIEIDLDETDAGKAEATVRSRCEKLLANPVIAHYANRIEALRPPPGGRRPPAGRRRPG